MQSRRTGHDIPGPLLLSPRPATGVYQHRVPAGEEEVVGDFRRTVDGEGGGQDGGIRQAGQMGNAQVTVQNLQVVRVDAERNLLLIRGAVPGATGGNVVIKPAVKA